MYIQITLREAGQIVLCLADRLLAVVKIEIIIIVFDTIFPENEVNGKAGNGIIYPLYTLSVNVSEQRRFYLLYRYLRVYIGYKILSLKDTSVFKTNFRHFVIIANEFGNLCIAIYLTTKLFDRFSQRKSYCIAPPDDTVCLLYTSDAADEL